MTLTCVFACLSKIVEKPFKPTNFELCKFKLRAFSGFNRCFLCLDSNADLVWCPLVVFNHDLPKTKRNFIPPVEIGQSAIESANNDHAMVVQSMLDNKAGNNMPSLFFYWIVLCCTCFLNFDSYVVNMQCPGFAFGQDQDFVWRTWYRKPWHSYNWNFGSNWIWCALTVRPPEIYVSFKTNVFRLNIPTAPLD